MNRNASGAEPLLKVVSRPSLYTSEVPLSVPEKSQSILASLEPDRPAKRISPALLLVLIGILFGGAIYWASASMTFSHQWSMPPWMETALNISKSPTPVELRQQARIVRSERPIEATAEESHAAAIVAEAMPPLIPLPPDFVPAKQASTDTLAKLEIEPAKAKNNDGLSLSPSTGVARKEGGAQAITNNVAPNKHADALKNNLKTAEAPRTTKQTKPEAAKSGKDEDVDLIAALLTRVSHQESTRQEASGKEVKHKAAVAPAKSSSSSASAKKPNQADANRDIVARTADDSTEGLLKRCKALGFIEGQLCRMRICSNLWGVDSACPAPEQSIQPNVN